MQKKLFRILSLVLVCAILLCGCRNIPEPDYGNQVTGEATPIVTKEPEPTPAAALDRSGRYVLNSEPLFKGGSVREAIIDDVDTSGLYTLTGKDNERVFYHIFVGSFSDSNGDGIGDLRGIINRFDYLNDGRDDSGLSLGVEGIWLSPIFASPSYHKYDTSDYYQIDPAFGTMDDLKELVKLCHERNVKLILDLVINHSGSQNEWFKSFCAAQRGNLTDDPYYDFYTVNDSIRVGTRTFSKITSTDRFYECNFSGDMPEMNFDNEFVYDTMLKVADYYLTDIDVDGFRFDAAKYIYYGEETRNVAFWQRFMTDLRTIKPTIYAVAEVWDSDGITTKYAPALNCFNFTMAQVDGMISSTVKRGNVNTFTSYTESYIRNIKRIAGEAESAGLIPNQPFPVSFIANHDTDRAAGYMTYASGYAKMAANLYLLAPGSSFIYYGEEIAMKGSRGSAATDANRRLAMLWGDSDTVKNPVGSTYEAEKQTNGTVADMLADGGSLYNHYKRLILIRKSNPEIARGEYHALQLKDTTAGGFVSVLKSADGSVSSVMVFHNTSGKPVTVDLNSLLFTDGTPASDLFNTASAHMTECAYAAMELEKTESSLSNGLLTIAEQSSVVLR